MMAYTGKGKWQRLLLENDEVRRWHRSLARRHKSTADNYLRALGRFLDKGGLRPWDLLEMEQKKVDRIVDDLIQDELDRKNMGSSVNVLRKATASWPAWTTTSPSRSSAAMAHCT